MPVSGWCPIPALLVFAAVSSNICGQPVVGPPRVEVQFLGRADSCRSVSIPALAVCAPGLVCSPRTGTCVPAPASYQLPKSNWGKGAEIKDTSYSTLTYNIWRQSRPHQAEEKLYKTAWSLNKLPVLS